MTRFEIRPFEREVPAPSDDTSLTPQRFIPTWQIERASGQSAGAALAPRAASPPSKPRRTRADGSPNFPRQAPLKQREGLGATSLKVWRFIAGYTTEKGYPPTMREMVEALGFATTSTAYYQVRALEAQGILTRDFDKARGIRLLRPPDEVLYQVEETSPEGVKRLPDRPLPLERARALLTERGAAYTSPNHVFYGVDGHPDEFTVRTMIDARFVARLCLVEGTDV